MGPPATYLVDFYNYRPPDDNRVDAAAAHAARSHAAATSAEFRRSVFNTESREEALDLIAFGDGVAQRSGLSPDRTFLPDSIHPKINLATPQTDLDAAQEECRAVVCGAIAGLLERTGLHPSHVDVLITACGIYCPTPSIASLVVNAFKLRQDIQAYHLGGMGCSCGVLAVSLARDLIKANGRANVLLVTTEVTTPAFYLGRDKARQASNALLRMGANAALLSSRREWVARAKYQLVATARAHLGGGDAAYRSIQFSPDNDGVCGLYLGDEFVEEACRGLAAAARAVAPQALTWRQAAARRAAAARARVAGAKPPPPKGDFFEGAVDHFLIHAGGATVLDAVGAALVLGPAALEPARAVLWDYGDVSSSSTWYALGFVESVRGIAAGEAVLQAGAGAGVKAGANVWRAARDIHDVQDAAPDAAALARLGARAAPLGTAVWCVALLAATLALAAALTLVEGWAWLPQ
ncbi:MAG: FAE1/Type III polyketide synthase-like protein-domain-containing protein [Monoraphidium minutum]|nr:MAG: FAE1/Type III polyketide synthase-like protein-domain-containing protein [Monoraphidium minutum]